MTLVSPCVGLCKLDEATGYCLGCARTGDEIAEWSSTLAAARTAVWDALPQRFAQLGVSCRRLPWDTETIRDVVLQFLREGAGTWVIGVVGAVAEFAAMPGATIEAERDGDAIIAQTPGGKLRFVIDDNIRALTFDAADVPLARTRLVLVVKRERGRPASAAVLTACGPDHDAIAQADRWQALFDLGLGRKEARFYVRVGPGAAQAALTNATGLPFPDSLPKIGPALLSESPTRVVESALGRIEVDTPIPPPGGTSPAGPHTHLLPDHLASGRAMPAGFDLPRAYLPGAIFYPAA